MNEENALATQLVLGNYEEARQPARLAVCAHAHRQHPDDRAAAVEYARDVLTKLDLVRPAPDPAGDTPRLPPTPDPHADHATKRLADMARMIELYRRVAVGGLVARHKAQDIEALGLGRNRVLCVRQWLVDRGDLTLERVGTGGPTVFRVVE